MSRKQKLGWGVSLGICSAAAVLALRWGAPLERWRVLPQEGFATPAAVVDGTLYAVRRIPTQAGAATSVHAMSMTELRPREILSVIDPEPEPGNVVINRRGIFYVTQEQLPPPTPAITRPGNLASLFSGPGQPPPRRERTWSREPRLRLWRAPLSGGRATELLPQTRTSRVAFAEDHVFWFRGPLTGPGKPLVTPIDEAPTGDLMVSDLGTGATRRLAALRMDGGFTACPDGVYWRLRNGGQLQYVHLRLKDNLLETMPVEEGESGSSLVEVGDRWLWFENAGGELGAPRRLVTAGIGIPRRVLVDLGPDASMTNLMTDGKHCYCFLAESSTDSRPNTLGKRTFCRIRTDGTPALERLAHFPDSDLLWGGMVARGWFHNGHFYFAGREKHENWLSWSGEGLRPKLVWMLYRVRLPE